jgi:hypothetical protein
MYKEVVYKGGGKGRERGNKLRKGKYDLGNKDKEPTEMDQLKQRIKALEERLANEDRLARD